MNGKVSHTLTWESFKPRSRKSRITRTLWGDLDTMIAVGAELSMRPSTIELTITEIANGKVIDVWHFMAP